jgi:hypothetical protein
MIALLLAAACGLTATRAAAQEAPQPQTVTAVASSKAAEPVKAAPAPAYKEYRGVRIGMSAEEAREKLGKPKDKDKTQDLYVFSDKEAVQVFYDAQQKVYAVSVNYMGKESGAPAPTDILGQDVEAKADGSIYRMQRYPEAGFWVSYNRTSGDSPLTTVTMQKMASSKQ